MREEQLIEYANNLKNFFDNENVYRGTDIKNVIDYILQAFLNEHFYRFFTEEN